MKPLVHQIWQGPSEDLAKRFHAKRQIQCVITDPPFGVDNQSHQAVTAGGRKHARKIANDESPERAMEIFTDVMTAVIPGMKDESDIYIFTSHQVLEEWLPFTRKLLEPYGFNRKATMVWEKDGPGMGDLEVWGMGMEFILYYKRGKRLKTDIRRNSVFHVPQVRPGALIHPHEKPLPLLEGFIKHSTNKGDFIVDPFAGSGSTVRAARRLGRSCVGIEYDEYNAAEANKALHESDGSGMDF